MARLLQRPLSLCYPRLRVHGNSQTFPLPACCSTAAAFRSAAAASGAARRAAVLRVAAQAAPATATAPPATRQRSQYELQTLTTWLLDLEKEGVIDNELAAVISSIGTACKQIGSLVNRAGISNLTGLAGEQNVQVGSARSRSGRPQQGTSPVDVAGGTPWEDLLSMLVACNGLRAFIGLHYPHAHVAHLACAQATTWKG